MEATVPSSPAPRNLSRYWLATRPYSFTAAVVPVLIGTAVGRIIFPSAAFRWLDFLLVLIGAVAIQCVSNLVNDYYDAKTKLDNPENFGRMNSLVSGLIDYRESKGLIGVSMAISAAIGVYFLEKIGAPLVWLLAAGLVLAVGYTAPPLKLKYRAMGDLAVLLGFGLGIALGAFMIQSHPQAGSLSPAHLLKLLVYCLPSALLVVGILHANNHRDRKNDREYGARTLGNVLSAPASKKAMFGFLLVPYAIVIIAVVASYATPWWLAVGLSVPPLMAILKKVQADEFEGMLVPEVAKLHGMFGVLTTVAILLSIALAR